MPLENVLSSEFLEKQSQLHIGPCYASYSFSGHQYAIPIDASAQFCALNPKSISRAGTPCDWEEFLELMRDPEFKGKVLWPLCPTDLWCSFLTLAAQVAKKTTSKVFDGQGLNIAVSREALDLMKRLIEHIPQLCFDLNPINALDMLCSQNEFAFAPLIFGYNNYCRPGFGELEFSNAIGLKGEEPLSLLGGAGIALSSKSENHYEIADFLRFIMQYKIMSGPYFNAGGQPSLKSTWESNTLNARSSNFFKNTIDTIAHAYTRPRLPGFNTFQFKAAELMHGTLRNSSEESIIKAIIKLYHEHCSL